MAVTKENASELILKLISQKARFKTLRKEFVNRIIELKSQLVDLEKNLQLIDDRIRETDRALSGKY